MNKPNRMFELNLKLGADSLKELQGALKQISIQIFVENIMQSLSGGYGSGWDYRVTENPGMTHDKYFEKVDKFLEKDKKE